MAIISILQYPDSRLKIKATKVEDAQNAKIQKIIDDMLETLGNTENCAALAATQLDIPNPPSITVVNQENPKLKPLCLINPEIIDKESECTEKEGCMSVYPDHIHAPVKRAKKVKVRALDRQGKTIVIEAEGFMARCLQHEIDHLNGTVYIDHISNLRRKLIDRKVKKLKK